MVSVVPLEQLGYQADFFKLPPAEIREVRFTYYTFDDSGPGGYPSYWDIVGLRRTGTLSIDVQLLHIDEEALEWPDFEALRDASGYLSLTLPDLQALLHFFEQWIDPDVAESEGRHSHFRLLDTEALLSYHVDRWRIQSNAGNYYLYMPDEGVLSSHLVSLIGCPHHMTKHSSSSLSFKTFDRRRLDDPQFDPSKGEWSGYMSFNQVAWQEFVALLKERA